MLNRECDELKHMLLSSFPRVPVISIHNPLNWDYTAIDLVTAQSTLGTGLITDISSGITDLFGVQSEKYNNKIQDGENLCKAALRSKALSLGANAVIAVDVDYTDMGGAKSMVCVCMTGTAVHLNNPEVFDANLNETISILKSVIARLEYLKRFDGIGS